MSRARVSLKRGVAITAAWVVGVSGMAEGVRADQLSVVARVGQSATGLPSGVTISRVCNFNTSEPPVIGSGGHIAFRAMLTGTSVTTSSDSGVFLIDPPSSGSTSREISLVAREGAAVPVATGDPAANFYTFGTPLVSDNGRVAFHAQLSGTTTTTARGYWCFDQSLRAVAREGVNGLVSLSEGTVLDTSGSLVAFKSGNTTAGISYWLGGSAGDSLVARSGQSAAGTTGANFTGTLRQVFNDRGQAVVYSGLSGGDTTSSNSKGIWYFNGSSLSLVARAGSQANGRANGVVWTDMSATSMTPSINSAGTILFPAFLSSASGAPLGQALYRRTAGGQPTLVAATGDAATAAGSGVAFANLSPWSVMPYATLADDGTVVFVATLSGSGVNTSNDRSIWSDGPRGRRMIVRGNQSLPGGQGTVQVSNASLGGASRINARGEVATLVTLSGSGVDSSNDLAIISDVSGSTHIVAQEGQVIPGSNGYRLSQISVGDLFLMNVLGQIVFRGWIVSDQSIAAPETAILRVDETGQLRILATDNKPSTFAGGQTVWMGGLYASPTRALSDSGQFTFSSDAVGGQAIFAVKIEPATVTISTGACCRGSTCGVETSTDCSGPHTRFTGSGTVCSTSQSAPCCPADFNQSGEVSVQDIFDFLSAMFANSQLADINRSGTTSTEDIFDFLTAFFAGC